MASFPCFILPTLDGHINYHHSSFIFRRPKEQPDIWRRERMFYCRQIIGNCLSTPTT